MGEWESKPNPILAIVASHTQRICTGNGQDNGHAAIKTSTNKLFALFLHLAMTLSKDRGPWTTGYGLWSLLWHQRQITKLVGQLTCPDWWRTGWGWSRCRAGCPARSKCRTVSSQSAKCLQRTNICRRASIGLCTWPGLRRHYTGRSFNLNHYKFFFVLFKLWQGILNFVYSFGFEKITCLIAFYTRDVHY